MESLMPCKWVSEWVSERVNEWTSEIRVSKTTICWFLLSFMPRWGNTIFFLISTLAGGLPPPFLWIWNSILVPATVSEWVSSCVDASIGTQYLDIQHHYFLQHLAFDEYVHSALQHEPFVSFPFLLRRLHPSYWRWKRKLWEIMLIELASYLLVLLIGQ